MNDGGVAVRIAHCCFGGERIDLICVLIMFNCCVHGGGSIDLALAAS